MNTADFKEEVSEKVRAVFNDTSRPVSDTKAILQELIIELGDVIDDIDCMIDSLPD